MSDLWFAVTRRDSFGAVPAWSAATSEAAAERVAARGDFGAAFPIDARLIDPPPGIVEALAKETKEAA